MECSFIRGKPEVKMAYCILEFIAESGRFYRYDGKGDLSAPDLAAFDAGKGI